MKSILCIEDNPEIQIIVEAALDQYRVQPVSTLAQARACLEKDQYDLLVLDLELPDGDGLKFLTEISQSPDWKNLPVFILTGKAEIANKVIAFSLGADDFISKPFDPLELRARVGAKLKKAEAAADKNEIIKIKDLLIHIPKQRVYVVSKEGQEQISLTSIEFKLLLTLARAPDRVFSRNHLLDEVWGSATHVTDRTVDTHIGHLRKKISGTKVKIETVINEGYRLLP